jgi:ribonuclease P protein component
MKRRFRLTRSIDFQRVRRQGKSYAHPLLVLIALPNQKEITRIGVTAGRAVGNAVQRNRAKRLVRAAIYPYLELVIPGWDLVLIARQKMKIADYKQTQDSLHNLLERAKLVK